MKGPLIKQRLAIATVAVVGSVVLTVQTFAEDHVCKGSPKVIGACRHVYGNLYLSADAGYVITFLDKPTVFVEPSAGSDKDMPDWLAKIMDSDLHANAQGDFEICPLRRRLGPTACIEAASNMLIEYRDGRTERRP